MKSIGWICLVFLLVIPISFSNIAINMGAPENASYSLNNIPIYFNVTGRAESYLCVNKFDVSNNNLTGYWRFDENNGTTIIDSSEYGNNGTISLDSNFFDGVALNENTTWTTSGKYGSGYKLNGLAGITFFENFTNSSAYTFCVWVKPENISATSFRFPLINTNGIGNQGEFYISYSSTRFDFAKASWDSWTAMTPIYNDTWTHLCVVLNDTKAYLYKDGTKLSLSTDDTTTGNLSFNGNISSGYRAGTTLTTTKMNDTIDEIRIWNRKIGRAHV